MVTPVIYVDFHRLRASCRTDGLSAIPLVTYGSLKDLSNQQVRLKEGMALTVYTDSAEGEDLEAKAIAYYDRDQQCWMVEIDEEDIRYVPEHETWAVKGFLCIECRQDLEPHFEEPGQSQQTVCPNCGASIMAPVQAP